MTINENFYIIQKKGRMKTDWQVLGFYMGWSMSDKYNLIQFRDKEEENTHKEHNNNSNHNNNNSILYLLACRTLQVRANYSVSRNTKQQ
jgi:hypothetical protein